jgi:hypothetical protein
MTENNGKNTEPVIVDIDLSLEDGIDPKKATEYLEKLFMVGERFGDLLHNEKLTIGETLFVIYILEKSLLSTMGHNDISHLLLENNKVKMNVLANMIVKNKIEKD